MRLDRKLRNWDQRLTLFVGYLIENKKQSSTVKSYISAICAVLQDNGIKLSDDQYLITSLTKACRLVNDKVHHTLKIQRPCAGSTSVKNQRILFKAKSNVSENFIHESLQHDVFWLMSNWRTNLQQSCDISKKRRNSFQQEKIQIHPILIKDTRTK